MVPVHSYGAKNKKKEGKTQTSDCEMAEARLWH